MKALRPAWLSRNVFVLSAVSLLNDAASEMVTPLLPIFLTGTLGASVAIAGLIEGVADAMSAVLKLVSGKIADRTGRHRPLLLAGYGLPALVRPLIAMATASWMVMGVRVLDRVGKGLRSSPRDALLAASAPEDRRGSVFSFHRAADHSGAVLGSLVAWAFLQFVTTDLRTLFWWSAAPGILVVLAVAFGVREEKVARPSITEGKGPLPPALKWLFAALGVFGMGCATESFLLLKAGSDNIAISSLPLLWMLLHIVKVVTALGAGPLADRIGRRRIIASGWIVFALLYVAFALVHSPIAIAGLFVAYGMYAGLCEGAEKALVAELTPAESRGTAFGWYHLVTGIVAIPAGLLFGGLWTLFGPGAAFGLGAALATTALIPLAISARASAGGVPVKQS